MAAIDPPQSNRFIHTACVDLGKGEGGGGVVGGGGGGGGGGVAVSMAPLSVTEILIEAEVIQRAALLSDNLFSVEHNRWGSTADLPTHTFSPFH